MKKHIPDEKIKNIHLVFYEYRDTKTLEIKGHFAPILFMKQFVAARYLLDRNKSKGVNHYTIGSHNMVFCHHCGKKFLKDSVNFIKHTSTCLRDTPTYHSMPKANSKYSFHNYANALPSPFTIICDTEADIRLMKDLCDECDAKLQFENTREGMIKILKDCDHEPNRFRSCTTCNLKVLEIRKKAEINCQHEGHTKENENLDTCNVCNERLQKNEDAIIHDSTHVIPCSVCTHEKDYCIHAGTEKLKTLYPLIYSLVVIDNIYDKIERTVTFGGKDPIGNFFNFLDDLRPELEEKHYNRCQTFPDLYKIMSRKEIKEYKSQNDFCWNCKDKLYHHQDKNIDHCHTTGTFFILSHIPKITLSFKIGKIRGLACRRCNEAMQEKKLGSIPLYFHNSSGYDSHLLLRHFPPNAEGKLSGKNRTINVT